MVEVISAAERVVARRLPGPYTLRNALRRSRKLGTILTTPMYRRSLLKHGVAATTEHRAIKFSDSIRTVVDVGASRGQFALFAIERWPAAAVHCFEPLPTAADALARHLRDRVDLYRIALGATTGPTTLNIAERDDSSSLLAQKLQRQEFPGTGDVTTVEVRLARLDDALTKPIVRPALLKLDVQGYEAAVLRGATRTLAKIDEILCECSFVELYEGQPLAAEVVALLHAAGFTLVQVGTPAYGTSGQPLQADFLFRRVGNP
jgi:FkbM family methyltransferase